MVCSTQVELMASYGMRQRIPQPSLSAASYQRLERFSRWLKLSQVTSSGTPLNISRFASVSGLPLPSRPPLDPTARSACFSAATFWAYLRAKKAMDHRYWTRLTPTWASQRLTAFHRWHVERLSPCPLATVVESAEERGGVAVVAIPGKGLPYDRHPERKKRAWVWAVLLPMARALSTIASAVTYGVFAVEKKSELPVGCFMIQAMVNRSPGGMD
jgi:hypothetical protein